MQGEYGIVHVITGPEFGISCYEASINFTPFLFSDLKSATWRVSKIWIWKILPSNMSKKNMEPETSFSLEDFILLKFESNEIVIGVSVQCSISENLDTLPKFCPARPWEVTLNSNRKPDCDLQSQHFFHSQP